MECETCILNKTHGGNCKTGFLENCLYYKQDPRGKILLMECKWNLEFSSALKEIKVGQKILDTFAGDVEIVEIHSVRWSYGKGKYGINGVLIHMRVNYFENEYSPEIDRKSILKRIK